LKQLHEINRITTDPDICNGKPCIRGMRNSVTMLEEMLKSGCSEDYILAMFPDLESGDLA